MRAPVVSVTLLLLTTAASCAGDAPFTCTSEGAECQFSEETLIDALPHVATLDRCRDLCISDDSCQYISYFSLNHICYLMKSCDTVTQCSDCTLLMGIEKL